MSKSYNNYIGLLDNADILLKKVKQIPTDTKTVEEPKNPDEYNVYQIVKHLIDAEEDQILREKYLAGGLSYKYAKEYLYEKLSAFLLPLQERFAEISDDEVRKLLQEHSEKVNAIATRKIEEIYQKI